MLSEKPWKLDRVVLVLLGIFVCCCALSLVGGLAQHFIGKAKPDENSLLYLVFVTMSLQGSILLATALFLRVQRISWGEAFGFSSRNMGQAILLGVLAAIIFFPIGDLLQAASIELIAKFHIKTPTQQAVTTLQDATALASRIYLIIFYVSIGPVGEEILFRGILYPCIKQAGYPRIALWGTSLAFAAIHVNLPIFIPLLVLGMVSVWLYEKTNNLLASITLHGAFNAIELIIMYFGDYLVQTFTRWFHHH
ncbi:MAG TPA: type II CAAX endopeptidase family protein [Verrucomicrobiae bacterium]